MADLHIGDDITEFVDEEKKWHLPEPAFTLKITCTRHYITVRNVHGARIEYLNKGESYEKDYESIESYEEARYIVTDPRVFGAEYQIQALGEPGPGPNEPPVADFEFPSKPANVGETVEVLNNSRDPDGRIVSYSWTWGDGTRSGKVPGHSYDETGDYTVSRSRR